MAEEKKREETDELLFMSLFDLQIFLFNIYLQRIGGEGGFHSGAVGRVKGLVNKLAVERAIPLRMAHTVERDTFSTGAALGEKETLLVFRPIHVVDV